MTTLNCRPRRHLQYGPDCGSNIVIEAGRLDPSSGSIKFEFSYSTGKDHMAEKERTDIQRFINRILGSR